jgi:sterol desaturase/sphingolipid hydroxylase (fatty acid hydroxylase superfamily)
MNAPSASMHLAIKRPHNAWRHIENALFLAAFAYLLYGAVSELAHYSWATLGGAGFIEDVRKPLQAREYYKSVLAVIWLLISVLTLWEIGRISFQLARSPAYPGWSRAKFGHLYGEIAYRYKATFMSALLSQLLPRIIVIDVFWRLLPHFQHLALVHTNFKWYSWVYAILLWDLSTWVWHYGAHKVRLLWCLHSPHHATEELNMTSAWVHFFAEGYYTAPLQLLILMVLGVQPAMLLVIMSVEVSWGTFIHAGERSLRRGRLGPLRFVIMTPAHHRVHHARNPLYLDRNFCTLLPFWDWLFGTLQLPQDGIRIEYGIHRGVDVTNFVDFYFGECLLLWRDLRSARGLRNRLLLAFKPPGWRPESDEKTATGMRSRFLADNPQLARVH